MTERSFLFLLGSARRDGNTETLALHAARSLPATVQQQWLRLLDLPLPTFEDIRHSVGVYPQPEGNEKILFDATFAATDLVFATPLYWYSVSALTKHYLDYWSAWMRVPDAAFRARMAGKTAWVISALSDDDAERMVEPLVLTIRLCAEYLKMNWGGVLLGNGSRPGDVLNDSEALEKARRFFIP